jgi:hypothetical protein
MGSVEKAMRDLDHLNLISSEELTQNRRVFTNLLGTALSDQGRQVYQDAIIAIDEELLKRDM